MAQGIEPTGGEIREIRGSWIHSSAEIGEGVTIEPGVYVGPGVRIGPGCVIHTGAVIRRDTILGRENRIHSTAVLGDDPQDVGYGGQPTRLEIGDHNVFREGVTIHRGSVKEQGVTRIGSRNFFMATAHVGHDSVVEDQCVFANGALIAGHCRIGRAVNFGGGAAVVQFVTVGRYAFLGGLAGSRQDLEPFLRHDAVDQGTRSRPIGVNVVGLRRAGFSEDVITRLKTAYRTLILDKGGDFGTRVKSLRESGAWCDEVQELADFLERKVAGRFGVQRRTRDPFHDEE